MTEDAELDAAVDPKARPVGKSPADAAAFVVIGAAQKVHRTLGCGFTENVYHQALARELILRKVPFESQKELEVFYEGALCGTFRPDFVFGTCLIVEIKAVRELCPEHWMQARSYINAAGIANALLVNFGGKSLAVRRIFNR
jgi:GxxExxY protein